MGLPLPTGTGTCTRPRVCCWIVALLSLLIIIITRAAFSRSTWAVPCWAHHCSRAGMMLGAPVGGSGMGLLHGMMVLG